MKTNTKEWVQYVGANTTEGAVVDVKGTDCSACASMINFWFNAKINAININGFIVPNGMMSDFEENMPTSVIGTAVESA